MAGAQAPYNFKSMWLQNILESGRYPLPVLLHEFQTMCEGYTRHIDKEIADCLRAEGHTAICDWYGCPSEVDAYWNTFPSPQWEEGQSQTDMRNIMHARY
jgi:hypothetical protein